MRKTFRSLIDLLDYFKDQDTCIEYLERRRWGKNITCPHCGHHSPYRTNRGFKCSSSDCYKKFSVISGTIFENTKLPLRVWFAAIYLCTSHKKGISSLQLSRDLNISQKSAWFLLHRIREMMADTGLLDGVVEIDETYIGGEPKNRHKSKRKKSENVDGRATKKSPVLGILQRVGNVFLAPIKDASVDTLSDSVKSKVEKHSTIITDGWTGYYYLAKCYNHEVVEHNHGEYVRDEFHINSVEGLFSMLKRGIIGIYHQVSKKHLARYCNEFSYRYNTRRMKDNFRFRDVFNNVERRLKYIDLIS